MAIDPLGLIKARYTRREPKPGGGYRYYYDEPATPRQSKPKQPATAQGRVEQLLSGLQPDDKIVQTFMVASQEIEVAIGRFSGGQFAGKHYVRATVGGKDTAQVGSPAELTQWIDRSATLLRMLDPDGDIKPITRYATTR